MQNIILTLFLVAAMFSCDTKNAGELPVFDVTKSLPAKTLVLRDIAAVEYIPLETREGFLMDNLYPHYMDEEIMVTSNVKGDIIIFDSRTGKCLTSFNRVGQGPGEYPQAYIHSIAVDRDRGEMYLSNGVTRSGEGYPIHVYDLEGKHLRTLRYNNLPTPVFFHSYDGDHLFFLNPDTSMPEPYGLISKTDTFVTRLPVRFSGRETMAVTLKTEHSVSSTTSGNSAVIAKTGEGYMFSEPGVDTIFRWNPTAETLTPVMARTPSFGSAAYPTGLFYLGESNDYMFLQTVERRFDFDTYEGFKTVPVIYDKTSGEFFEATIVNDDLDGWPFRLQVMPGVPAGQFITLFQPLDILDLHEKGVLKGDLAQIAPTLKEDDNPVVMIVTFK